MKTKIIKSTIIIAILGVVLFACNKQEEKPIQVENTVEPSMAQGNHYIQEFSCIGSCANDACGGLFTRKNGDINYMECTCTECILQVIITNIGTGQVSETNSTGARVEVEFIAEFVEFFETTYGSSDPVVTKVTRENMGEIFSVLYEFVTPDGDITTVMFAMKGGGEKITIDCTDFVNYSIAIESDITNSNVSTISKQILLSSMSTTRWDVDYWLNANI